MSVQAIDRDGVKVRMSEEKAARMAQYGYRIVPDKPDEPPVDLSPSPRPRRGRPRKAD